MGSARVAALEALEKWRRNATFADESLKLAVSKHKLDSRDSALAAALCYGVLQHLYRLKYYVNYYSTTPCKSLQPKVLDILCLSAYQILFMDKIPDSAAVNEGVALCKASGMAKASGLVNAVLRRICENKDAMPEVTGENEAEIMSTYHSVPLWLCEYVISRLGTSGANRFFTLSNETSSLTLQTNTLKTSSDSLLLALKNAGIESKRHDFLPDCIVCRGGGAQALSLAKFSEGHFYVQDAASQLAARAARPKPTDKILDCCAAPGGKSFALSILSGGEAEIISCDIAEKKVRLISDGAKRLGLNRISARCADAKVFCPEWEGAFDLVLCDVPCSGFGVISKKPEIRYKSREEIARLPEIQLQILKNASRYVKRGGTLIYSTCTILREENEDNVTAFLAENDMFEAEDFSLCGDIKSERAMLTLWPQTHGTDGFFVSRLRRIK